MCIILSNSKRGQTSMLISYAMKEALYMKPSIIGVRERLHWVLDHIG